MEHICNKKTEIELMKQNNIYITQKVDEIHKMLVGNGRPGLVTDVNEIKGALKFTQVFFGLLIASIGVLVTIL